MGRIPLIGILGHLGGTWALEVRVSLCCNKDLVRIWLMGYKMKKIKHLTTMEGEGEGEYTAFEL